MNSRVLITLVHEWLGRIPAHLDGRENVSIRELLLDERISLSDVATTLTEWSSSARVPVLPIVDAAIRTWLPIVLDAANLPGHAETLRLLPEVVDERTARAAREAVLCAEAAARLSPLDPSAAVVACMDAHQAARLRISAADYAADVLRVVQDSPDVRTSLLRVVLLDEDIRRWYHLHGKKHPIGTVDAAHRGDSTALRLIARELDGAAS